VILQHLKKERRKETTVVIDRGGLDGYAQAVKNGVGEKQ
jgi:hypothetical protein